MAKPFYNLPQLSIRYANDFKDETGKGEMQTYSLRRLQAFMYYVLEREELTIAPFLDDMGHKPYFLLAATGLGKTVAAPIHSFLKHCEQVLANVKPRPYPPLWKDEVPRIWIVEPKISIAQAQTEFMNSLFEEFIRSGKNPKDVAHPTLFGCKTSVHSIHYHSPIKFVTTGIFAIFARFGYLDPARDAVVIDEAHVTIESSEGVELAIAICRAKGVPIHYMSATVDRSNLHETLGVHNIIDATKMVRKPKWMHNTGQPMEECIVELVEKTLVHPDPTSHYFPLDDDSTGKEIRSAVLEEGRAKGFLIVVNSFAGEDSDANKVAELLRNAPYASEIEILLLASAVIRSAREKKRFDETLERLNQERKKYVIIATSVVEMGVTFPTLDFVATMDSGYEQITIGDTVLPEIAPLPVNSMLQRIGRVGRKRPGIGYITNEVDAYYSSMSDEELNGGGLQYEPIRLPLGMGSLTLVAYYSFRQEWQDPIGELVKLNLPSKIHEDYDRVFEFVRQRQRLLDLGIAVDNQLTEDGKYCERWLEAGVDLGYAIEIQEALSQGRREDLLFYLVAATLSNVTLSTLRAKDEVSSLSDFKAEFNTRTGALRIRRGITLRGQDVEFTPQSDLIALYNVVCYFSNKYAKLFLGAKSMSKLVRSSYQDAFQYDCASCGFDPEQVEKLLHGFSDILRIFVDTNWNREDFKSIFGEVRKLTLTDFVFSTLSGWDIQRFLEEVANLPGRIRIKVTEEEIGFSWQEIDADRTGIIFPGSTSLILEEDLVLTARLLPLPGRGKRRAWKIIHAQYEGLHNTSPEEKQESAEEKPGDEEERQDGQDY